MIFSNKKPPYPRFISSRKGSCDSPLLIEKNPILEGVRSTSVCVIDWDCANILYFNNAARSLFEAFKTGGPLVQGCQAGPVMEVGFLRIKQAAKSMAFRTETLLQEEKECEHLKFYDLIQEFLKSEKDSMRFMLRKTVDLAHVPVDGLAQKRPKKISLKSTRSPSHQDPNRKKSSKLSLSFPFIREEIKRKTDSSTLDQEEMIFDLELTCLETGENNQRAVIAFFTDITHVKQKTLSREFDAFKQVSLSSFLPIITYLDKEVSKKLCFSNTIFLLIKS